MKLRLPHPLLVLLACVALAAASTWLLPAGTFDRRVDADTGRTVVVPGTFHPVEASPVGPFAALVAVPRGFVEAADVVGVVLFVGGAWVVLDSLGVLERLVAAFVGRLRGRTSLAIPLVTTFFATMGALENMQEEIIPLVPVLLVLGRSLRVDAVTVVATSVGAAMVGSAFGPTNPFQAGIAMKLAQLPPLEGVAWRLAILVGAVLVWLVWTMRHAARHAQERGVVTAAAPVPASSRDALALLCLIAPMGAYVIGAARWEWGFNELSAGFLLGGLAAGLVGGLTLERTVERYLEGMKGLLAAAVLVGVARSISLVLTDGRVIDTMLQAMTGPLGAGSPALSALLMVPFHVIVHIPVSSVSGHAVLTMPLLVPLSDLIGVSRQVTVLAYQIGAGLTELVTPTNGSLMAILLAAGVPFGRWFRFAAVGAALAAAVGLVGMMIGG